MWRDPPCKRREGRGQTSTDAAVGLAATKAGQQAGKAGSKAGGQNRQGLRVKQSRARPASAIYTRDAGTGWVQAGCRLAQGETKGPEKARVCAGRQEIRRQ